MKNLVMRVYKNNNLENELRIIEDTLITHLTNCLLGTNGEKVIITPYYNKHGELKNKYRFDLRNNFEYEIFEKEEN